MPSDRALQLAEELRRDALEIFDGPETSQDVRDVIEWFASSALAALSQDCTLKAADAKKAVQHVCGLQGFGALGDVCPACQKGNRDD